MKISRRQLRRLIEATIREEAVAGGRTAVQDAGNKRMNYMAQMLQAAIQRSPIPKTLWEFLHWEVGTDLEGISMVFQELNNNNSKFLALNREFEKLTGETIVDALYSAEVLGGPSSEDIDKAILPYFKNWKNAAEITSKGL